MASQKTTIILAGLLSFASVISSDRLGGGSSYAAPPQNTQGGRGGNGYPGGSPPSFGGGNGGPPFGASPPGFGGQSADAGLGGGGGDFPEALSSIPETSFSCEEQEFPGYYADIEAECQVFHICQEDGRQDSFLCGNGSLFNQEFLVCDWHYNVDCAASEQFFSVNGEIGKVPEGGNGGNGGGFGGGGSGNDAGFGGGNGYGNGGSSPGSFGSASGPAPNAPSLGYGAPGK